MKSHIKTFTTDPHKVEIHKLANITPRMTEPEYNALVLSIENLGQLTPVIMFQGQLVDGRHRLKAIKDLGIKEIIYTNLKSNMTLKEVEMLLTHGYEQRRHQSKTQKAIFAYRELEELKKQGENITQGEIADKHGIHINDISLVRKLMKISSTNVVNTLFNGGKIKLSNGKHTDNLRAIIKYFQTITNEATEDAFKQPVNITDDEWEMINNYAENLSENHSSLILKTLANVLYNKAK